jgi:hypothetical protein
MMNLELATIVALRNRQEMLDVAERERLLAAARPPRVPFVRRAVCPLGRALVWLGAALLRYGRGEQVAAMPVYRVKTQSLWKN